MPRTVEQARALFLSAQRMNPTSWISRRFELYALTNEWEMVFCRWVELCNEEGYVKDAFFSAGVDFVIDEERVAVIFDDMVGSLKNVAALKWLSFLSDFQNQYHRKTVMRLTLDWVPLGSPAHRTACSRRNDFALSLIERGLNNLPLIREALAYCMEGSAERLYALERIQFLESREK